MRLKEPKITPTHNDAGLQPERTHLAWGRTALSLVVTATFFLRWLPHHGIVILTLVAAALGSALAITVSHNRRFRRAVDGINSESMNPDATSAALMSASIAVLAAVGIYLVLFIPAH